jgi:hypothetical protein
MYNDETFISSSSKYKMSKRQSTDECQGPESSKKTKSKMSKSIKKKDTNADGTYATKSVDGNEQYLLFYGGDGVVPYLSNFYLSKFTIDELEFNCVEQYYHYKKAGTYFSS